MKAKYTEIMDKIEVTEDMRSRILSNVNEAVKKKDKSKIVSIFNLRTIGSIAAVLAVFGIGFATYRQVYLRGTGDVLESTEVAVMGPMELESREQLITSVGFDIEELDNIPFEVTEKIYVAYDKEGAEIIYLNEERKIVYTKTNILGGNNGHYEEYETEKNIDYNGLDVTLRENSEGAYIATWQKDNYEYMIYSDVAISEEELLNMIPN